MATMTPIIAFRRAFLPVAFVLLVCGCTVSKRLHGTYLGTMNIPVNAGTDPFVAAQLRQVRVVTSDDGKTSISVSGIPVNGILSYGSSAAAFKPVSIAGVPIERQKPGMEEHYSFVLTPLSDDSWSISGTSIPQAVTLRNISSDSSR